MIDPKEYQHPEDAAALRNMEKIPGLSLMMKKFLSIGLETLVYGTNMASSIRLSKDQLPEIYNILPPICETLGVDEPEFYLQMSPIPNAWTFGDTRKFITVTSALIEMMNEEELRAVIAHECGHIASHHVLYHSMATMIVMFAGAFEAIAPLTVPVQYALLYWQRKSELTCDRAAALVTSPQAVTKVMARLSGGPKSLTGKVNMERWAEQADEYDKIYNDGLWNKALQIMAVSSQNHPFSAVRVREILKWAETEQYRALAHRLEHPEDTCPQCHKPVGPGWKFCKNCGHKL